LSASAAANPADACCFPPLLKRGSPFCFLRFPPLQSNRFAAAPASSLASLFASRPSRFLGFFLRRCARARLLHRETGNSRAVLAGAGSQDSRRVGLPASQYRNSAPLLSGTAAARTPKFSRCGVSSHMGWRVTRRAKVVCEPSRHFPRSSPAVERLGASHSPSLR
jgi:hypothetical protein